MEDKLKEGLQPKTTTGFSFNSDNLNNLQLKCKALISRFDHMSDCFFGMSNNSISNLYYYNRELSQSYSTLSRMCNHNSEHELENQFETMIRKIENLHYQILLELTSLKKDGVEFINGNGIKVLVNKVMTLHQETLVSLRFILNKA